jgi:glycosyltransferase involved in cell wall biosynthesis
VRVILLGAGASTMICGSCLRDNRLAATLIEHGRNVILMPLYTPLRTDETPVATRQVLYGGINVYLEQKSAWFRAMPQVLTRVLDWPALLGSIGRFAAKTRPQDVADLALSVLRGQEGRQRAELEKLIEALRPLRPDLVNLPDLMFVGLARALRDALDVPIVCTLSGEDLFLDALPPADRDAAIAIIRERATDVDAFIAVTHYYRNECIRRFELAPDRVHYVPLGLRVEDALPCNDFAGGAFHIAYVARIAPEKGLFNLVQALVALRREGRSCTVSAAGWMSPNERPYLAKIEALAGEVGGPQAFRYLGEVDRQQKFALLQSAHAFSVPTNYHEAKGLPVLEALAAGLPVVQPRHGSFPELVESTGGGLLYDPSERNGLKNALARLMDDAELRRSLGQAGRAAVRARHTDHAMARETWVVYERVAAGSTKAK